MPDPNTTPSIATNGKMDSAAIALVEKLISLGITGAGPFDSAAEVADAALAESKGDVEKAIDKVYEDHRKLVVGEGFITGIGGFITLPVALPANIVSFFTIATRAVAAMARLRGYDIDRDEVRTAVLMILMGTDAKGLMAKAGVVSTGGRVADLAAQRLPEPALMVLNKGIGFHLLSSVGQKSLGRIVGRGLPVAGGFIGAGADWYLMRQLFGKAKKEFPLRAEFTPTQD